MNNSNDSKHAIENPGMEQVRELLFGAQLKDMENRFKRQEDWFIREIAETKNNAELRLKSLEDYVKNEIFSVISKIKDEKNSREASFKEEKNARDTAVRDERNARESEMKDEQKERSKAVNQLIKDLEGLAEDLDANTNALSEKLEATERDIRSLIFAEKKALDEKINSNYADALVVLAKTAKEIRNDMVHRSSLSSLFMNMVVKLSAEPYHLDPDKYVEGSPSLPSAPKSSPSPAAGATPAAENNKKN